MPDKHHADRIWETVQSNSAAASSGLAASWRRSVLAFGLSPESNELAHRISTRELGLRRERMGRVFSIAQPSLDELFRLVGRSGCCVLFTDAEGIVLDQRSTDGDQIQFNEWGLSTGADWSERSEGTNGIGTCLTEQRRVIINKDEHFHTRNTDMTCFDAPIFGPDGELVAALDVSSCRAEATELVSPLISSALATAAQRIEAESFRAHFPYARIIFGEQDNQTSPVLLAVDDDDLLVGATRAARKLYRLNDDAVAARRPASDVLRQEQGISDFENAERAELRRALSRADGNVSAAARQLGIGRATIYRRMQRLGLH